MIANIRVADAINFTADGDMNLLGEGKGVVGPPLLSPFVVVVEVIDNEFQYPSKYEISLRLFDSAGNVAAVGNLGEEEPMNANSTMMAEDLTARPPGIPEGVRMVVSFGPGMSINPGVYKWVAYVNGETHEQWVRHFYVRKDENDFPPDELKRTKQG